MARLDGIFVLVCVFLVVRVDCKRAYGDMFRHKHKVPFPFLISGWEPDTNSWDESLYPPFKPEFKHRYGKPQVRLASNSPAMNGSCLTFIAKLEFPRCQKEDSTGNLVHDGSCVNADGQVLSTYWTSWLDDYGFGRCTDLKRCNVFPDGKPFPHHSDWRRRGFVYVWHTMGQYFETYDGLSSSITLNTTNWTLGAGVMEVMVYSKRERRKYIPLSTDSTVFIITDQIPLFVNVSQKEAANITEKNVFIKGYDIIFKVQIHDPSSYLKNTDSLNFIWDFGDGKQLITQSSIATHAYGSPGNATVKLIVKAAFRTQCPPPTPPTPSPTHVTLPYTVTTPPASPKAETTEVITSPSSTTELFPSEMTTNATPTIESGFGSSSVEPLLLFEMHDALFTGSECFRYMYGNFEDQLVIIDSPFQHMLPNHIVDVSAAMVTNTTVNFVVTCSGSLPTSVCTTVADSTCHQVMSIVCDDVNLPDEGCLVTLKRTFQDPGTYCVNITLGLPSGLALSTTTVTIGNSLDNGSTKVAKALLTSSAVLLVIFAFITLFVYKRHKVYRPVRHFNLENNYKDNPVRTPLSRLKVGLFPANEERSRLLTDRHF